MGGGPKGGWKKHYMLCFEWSVPTSSKPEIATSNAYKKAIVARRQPQHLHEERVNEQSEEKESCIEQSQPIPPHESLGARGCVCLGGFHRCAFQRQCRARVTPKGRDAGELCRCSVVRLPAASIPATWPSMARSAALYPRRKVGRNARQNTTTPAPCPPLLLTAPA
jgi:hypothetical protein